jgi:hypothetical protein
MLPPQKKKKQTNASAADYMWNGAPKVLRLVDVSPIIAIKILEGFYIRSNGS